MFIRNDLRTIMGVIVVGGLQKDLKGTHMIMASKQHGLSRDTSGPLDTITCQWSVPCDKIIHLSNECELVNILMKHDNYRTENKYTVLDVELP